MTTPDPRPPAFPAPTPPRRPARRRTAHRRRPVVRTAVRAGAAPSPRRPGTPGETIGRTLAAALLVFVTVVLVLFVMFNTQTVDISLVFTDVEAPLVLALLIAAVLGGLVVALLGAVRCGRRRKTLTRAPVLTPESAAPGVITERALAACSLPTCAGNIVVTGE